MRKGSKERRDTQFRGLKWKGTMGKTIIWVGKGIKWIKRIKRMLSEEILVKHIFKKPVQEVNVRFRKWNNKLIYQMIAKNADLT